MCITAPIIPKEEEIALTVGDLDIDDNLEKNEGNKENFCETNTNSGLENNILLNPEENTSSKVAESMEKQTVKFFR